MPVGRTVLAHREIVSNIPIDITFSYVVGTNDPPRTVEELIVEPQFPDRMYMKLTYIKVQIPATSTAGLIKLWLKYVDVTNREEYLLAKILQTDTTAKTLLIEKIDTGETADYKYVTGCELIAKSLKICMQPQELPDQDYKFIITLRGYEVLEVK